MPLRTVVHEPGTPWTVEEVRALVGCRIGTTRPTSAVEKHVTGDDTYGGEGVLVEVIPDATNGWPWVVMDYGYSWVLTPDTIVTEVCK